MAFSGAHNFTVQGNINAVDNSRYGGVSAFDRLEKAACIGASHHSAERFDPPKCHPETRKAILTDIMNWINSKGPNSRIMWLSAPAGAGKSAIAQTIAEICDEYHKLLSSFFFSRTAASTGRDDGSRLIPTMAYHLAIAVPRTKDAIIDQIEKDPAVLQYSMDVQIRNLIVQPLLHATEEVDDEVLKNMPHVVIIDGLDECNKSYVQSKIIKMISRICVDPSLRHVRLRFFIASRSELEIRNTFNIPTVKSVCDQLTLGAHHDTYMDIRIYLQSEFENIKETHTLASDLAQNIYWPSHGDLDTLVYRSSGQFIYPYTVIKFLENNRHDPRERLRAIIDTSAASADHESPYAQLDALYTYVLSKAAASIEGLGYNAISPVFQTMLYTYRDWNTPNLGLAELAELIGIKQSTLQLRLTDLHSIVDVPNSSGTGDSIRFYHASFSDYLKDQSRSDVFFIDETKAHVLLAHYCLSTIMTESDGKLKTPRLETIALVKSYAYTHYFHHLNESNMDDVLIKELREQDLRFLVTSLFAQNVNGACNSLIDTLFKLNYGEDGSSQFSAPKSNITNDICNRISEVIDELMLESFTPSTETYFNCIVELKRRRSSYRYLEDVCLLSTDGWKSLLIESPERGKAIFLSDENSQVLFCGLVDLHDEDIASGNKIYHEIFCGNGQQAFDSEISEHQRWLPVESPLPIVLEYLLKRIKPSTEFAAILEGFKPRLSNFLDQFDDAEIWHPTKIYAHFSPIEVIQSARRLKTSLNKYTQECASISEDRMLPLVNKGHPVKIGIWKRTLRSVKHTLK